MSEAEKMVLELIPYGEEKAVSRHELVASTSLTDREIRHIIASLRENTVILSRSSGGYYLPTADDIPNIQEYIRKERCRAMSILKGLKYVTRYLEDVKRGIY